MNLLPHSINSFVISFLQSFHSTLHDQRWHQLFEMSIALRENDLSTRNTVNLIMR